MSSWLSNGRTAGQLRRQELAGELMQLSRSYLRVWQTMELADRLAIQERMDELASEIEGLTL